MPVEIQTLKKLAQSHSMTADAAAIIVRKQKIPVSKLGNPSDWVVDAKDFEEAIKKNFFNAKKISASRARKMKENWATGKMTKKKSAIKAK